MGLSELSICSCGGAGGALYLQLWRGSVSSLSAAGARLDELSVTTVGLSELCVQMSSLQAAVVELAGLSGRGQSSAL